MKRQAPSPGRVLLTKEGVEILKLSHLAFSKVVEGKFGCTAVIRNVDLMTPSSLGSNKTFIVPERKYSKQLSNGMTISVWKDDLTNHKVDAVVNAANENLQHGGGLALALSKAGGPEIQKMSDQITSESGPVPTGKAVYTSAGKLPCQHIIHAVGPYVSQNPSKNEVAKAKPFLEKAIWSILQITEYINLTSVAIPAVSSGLYNFPRDICANIIVNTVKQFDHKRQQQNKIEVRLVNNDDPTVFEMHRACKQFLGPPDSNGGTANMQSKSSSNSGFPTLELGNVTLIIKKGAIEKQATDVIVNTTAPDLDLSNGAVSKAILNEAGHKIQEEVKKAFPAHNGSVVPTSAYKLNCKAVYHTVCAQKSHSFAEKILQSVVSKCLDMASQHGFSSVSFPAIGTGNLRFHKDEVATIMTKAVAEFAKTYKGRKMDVFIVIFPSDKEIFKAFEKEIESTQKRLQVSPAENTSSSTSKVAQVFTYPWDVASKASSTFHQDEEATPYIDFYAGSVEAKTEACEWIVQMLDQMSPEITINNNYVMHFSQDDHAKLRSFQDQFSVIIKVFFKAGKGGIIITGEPLNVCQAYLEMEQMLCQAQEDFVRSEEQNMLHSVVRWQGVPGSERPEINAELEKSFLTRNDTKSLSVNGQHFKVNFKRMMVEDDYGQHGQVERTCIFSHYSMTTSNNTGYYQKTLVDPRSSLEKDTLRKFSIYDLNIVKVEKIENYALQQLFKLNSKRVPCRPEKMYQLVNAQFCELICRVGFQREFAPPKEERYGAGIYFTNEVQTVKELWDNNKDKYIYIIVAQVLTGKHTHGKPDYIVPPPAGSDPLDLYNSVTNAYKNVYVIFNGQQALPEFIITCKLPSSV